MSQKQLLLTPRGPETDLNYSGEDDELSPTERNDRVSPHASPLQGNSSPLQGNEISPPRGTKSPLQGNKLPQRGRREAAEQGELSSSNSEDDSDTFRGRSRSKFIPSRKRKHVDDISVSERSESDVSGSQSSDSELSDIFDPSKLCKRSESGRIPRKIRKYAEKYAIEGVSKKVRQDITKECPKPESKKLATKETDRFIKKLFREKFQTPLSAKKEKVIINTQNRILDAVGPLSILWKEAERLEKKGKAMDPRDVIAVVQRCLVLVGNAHFVYMTDRRKSLLAKLLPDAMDLLEDSNGKKALRKAKENLFGRKFLQLLSVESKENRELYGLMRRKKGRNSFNTARKTSTPASSSFFQQRPSRQAQSGGQYNRGRGQYHNSNYRSQWQPKKSAQIQNKQN